MQANALTYDFHDQQDFQAKRLPVSPFVACSDLLL